MVTGSVALELDVENATSGTSMMRRAKTSGLSRPRTLISSCT
jgi:hypothetical protein